jgi:hypothetical protein
VSRHFAGSYFCVVFLALSHIQPLYKGTVIKSEK